MNKVFPPTPERLREAADVIKRGGLVAFPTETVYGLGANALYANAAERIYRAKGRPSDNPLIVHFAQFADVAAYARDVPELAVRLAETFMPGPLTIILQKNDDIPLATTGGLDTVAVRVPSNETARELIRLSGVPIAAPSANVSGSVSPTSAEHVSADFAQEPLVEMIIDGGGCAVGLESTIVDLSVSPPTLLRPGAVTLDMLRNVSRDFTYANTPKAPGMKYRHYAPHTPTILISENPAETARIIAEYATNKTVGVIVSEQTAALLNGVKIGFIWNEERLDVYAKQLFGALRALDSECLDIIVIEATKADGIGYAIMNRVRKAAE